ncbi:tyrosine-type recombinase/integrase [Vibrio alginolyticus]|nr:tyrosine-type recombinase/integrase [Vibrio alginolyticus]
MPKKNLLCHLKIEHAKCPEGKQSLVLNDGDRLQLVIYPTGKKVFRLRIKRLNGKEALLTLGSVDSLSLEKARKLRDDILEKRTMGEEPKHVLNKLQRKCSMTVGDLVLAYLEAKRTTWKESTFKNESQRAQKYLINSDIGSIPIHALTLKHIYDFARNMDQKGYKKQHKKIISLLNGAVKLGKIEYDVSEQDFSDICHFLTKRKSKHHASIDIGDLGGLSKLVACSNRSLQTKLHFDFMFLVPNRVNEATQHKWINVDFDNATITIPSESSKNHLEHIVPLSPQALHVLKLAKIVARDSEYIFPSPHSSKLQPISTNTLGNMFREMGLKGQMTTHGIRSLFSSEMHESLDTADSIIIEMILSHTDRDHIRAIYNRKNFIGKRRDLLNLWGQIYAELTKEYSCTDYVEKELTRLKLISE